MSFQRGKLSFPLTAECTYFPWPFSDHTALLHFKAGVRGHIGFTSSLKPGIWVEGPFCFSSYKCSNHGHRSSQTWVWQGTSQVISRRELPAGCELKQAPRREERARRVKCVRCIISPLYSRAVILYLFFSTTGTAENMMKAMCFS